jgi:hypothetical protein
MRLLGKWLPKVYGDRTTIAGDTDSPVVIKRQAAEYSDEELAAIIAAGKRT